MYREPASRPEAELPPRELVYAAEDRADRRRLGTLAIPLVAAPVLALALLSAFVSELLGVAAFAASTAAVVWWWRRAWRPQSIVIRVERSDLQVRIAGSLRTMRLDDLVDVALDIKTIQRVVDGNSPIPALRFADTRVGPEVDTARIVLVGRDEQTPLTEAYLAHMDATEWLGKIRVFLRKHGWLPDDERDAPDA